MANPQLSNIFIVEEVLDCYLIPLKHARLAEQGN